jgi:GTP-binding protein Era
MDKTSHCGYVAIIGRPNVGKSTLLNSILGKKICITSAKPQTTRDQILGIKSEGATQAIYIDTPGLHEAEARAINRYMNRLANAVIVDADVVIFMVEALCWYPEDEAVLTRLKQSKHPVILAINKVDEVKNKAQLLPFIEKIKAQFDFAHIIPISATTHENIEELENLIASYLPEGPHLYPDDQVTDKTIRFQVAEIIREKVIKATEQEVPYSSTVQIEELKIDEKLVEINAIIWVERIGQKPIIIGKNGERLKKIGTQARRELEVLLKQKVFLRLWVKVKNNWTDDDRILRSLGFE